MNRFCSPDSPSQSCPRRYGFAAWCGRRKGGGRSSFRLPPKLSTHGVINWLAVYFENFVCSAEFTRPTWCRALFFQFLDIRQNRRLQNIAHGTCSGTSVFFEYEEGIKCAVVV